MANTNNFQIRVVFSIFLIKHKAKALTWKNKRQVFWATLMSSIESNYDRPTLVFLGIKSAFLIWCTFNPTNLVLSKWACFMPGKTKVGWTIISIFFISGG